MQVIKLKPDWHENCLEIKFDFGQMSKVSASNHFKSMAQFK